ncbi:trypsin 3A1-like [Aricia agestis]|uniref:trypsin 3A1-like n=1 Tax=Aricia agestis TaxID=91739 RepID=UPI001C206F3F|nr:trypsin 3A1-like [Aricia agestis]
MKAVIGIILGCFCASVVSQSRISNGDLAATGQFPYAVSLQLTGNQQSTTRGHRCGGALISLQHVLTTASCLFDFAAGGQYVLINPSQYRIFSGATLLTNDTSADRVRAIQNFTIHPDYTGTPALLNNIAIITLTVPFAQNAVTPISLPAASHNPADFTLCTVTGWGGVNSTTTGNTELMYATKYIYNQDLCASLYNPVAGALNILPSMVCAVSYDTMSSGCAGDDGNPLVCNGVFTGLLSLSDGCRSSSYPEVYTRVSNYTTWIRTISGSPSLYSSGIFIAIALLFAAQASMFS